MDVTNYNLILKELHLLYNNCNSLEDNILKIGMICFTENNYKKDISEVNRKNSAGISINIYINY